VLSLLAVISISAFNTRNSSEQHLFVRTHVAGYFISMLIGDVLQAIGSIMNSRWAHEMMAYAGPYCTAQGAIKQAADISTSIWVLAIGIHTFCQIFLQWTIRPYVLWSTLVFVWSSIITILLVGPAALNTENRGPFYGISGFWCWISENYPTERVTLDYMIMFSSAFIIFILYTLVYLRLRGNIIVSGWYIRFRFSSTAPWRGRELTNNRLMGIAKQMLLYPVAYTILILPIASARFSEWAGRDVPFQVTVFCDTIFLLSGLVNVILFTTTRRVLPPQSLMGIFSISRPSFLGGSTSVDMTSPEDFEKGSQMSDDSRTMVSDSETVYSVPHSVPQTKPGLSDEQPSAVRPPPAPPLYAI
jgi:hypothetical protein